MSASFQQRTQELIEAGRWLSERGLVPATSGNLSARLDNGEFAITVSGRHKGHLQPDDIMRIDAEGGAVDNRRPSAETLLHVQLYRLLPQVNLVLHPHSARATVLSRQRDEFLQLSGYELLKAFDGIDTHETTLSLPIFENDQDIARLASEVEPFIHPYKPMAAYLIRGHGYYTWGSDLAAALRHVEALEFLFECELLRGAG